MEIVTDVLTFKVEPIHVPLGKQRKSFEFSLLPLKFNSTYLKMCTLRSVKSGVELNTLRLKCASVSVIKDTVILKCTVGTQFADHF